MKRAGGCGCISPCGRMSLHEADVLEYELLAVEGVSSAKVFDRTQDAVIVYESSRQAVIHALAAFSFAAAEANGRVPERTPRALNREFEDKLAMTVMRRVFSQLFLPAPVTTADRAIPLRSLHQGGPVRALAWEADGRRARCDGSHGLDGARRLRHGRLPSCSCCGWAKFWRSGRARSPSPISPEPWR